MSYILITLTFLTLSLLLSIYQQLFAMLKGKRLDITDDIFYHILNGGSMLVKLFMVFLIGFMILNII